MNGWIEFSSLTSKNIFKKFIFKNYNWNDYWSANKWTPSFIGWFASYNRVIYNKLKIQDYHRSLLEPLILTPSGFNNLLKLNLDPTIKVFNCSSLWIPSANSSLNFLQFKCKYPFNSFDFDLERNLITLWLRRRSTTFSYP
jgi:hypothetical protein